MKILAITRKDSAIDIWRVKRPMRELSKHVDWQIDYQADVIRDHLNYDHPDEFMGKPAEEEAKHLGQYDIVFTSYFSCPYRYALLKMTEKHYGTKFILDIDDDMYSVDPENPFWLAAGEDGGFFLQTMARITDYISTTTEELKAVFLKNSEVKPQIFLNPNYISRDYKEGNFQNDNLTIGYFGGASHYHDIHETGVLEAVQKIMHEYKDVHFKVAGNPVDVYLPKQRSFTIEAEKGDKWVTELFPKLNYDIALAPLRDTEFSKGKSNIKWQEATRMGAAVIASDVGPYRFLKNALKVPNTREAWYLALKELIDNETKRKQLTEDSKKELKYIEDNWQSYKAMFEAV